MNFLLEIGVEEIPDWMIPGALASLRDLFAGVVQSASIQVDGTPRRLALRAWDVPAREPDSEERVNGPAKSAPAAAVAGFARKLGVVPERLEIASGPKGQYYSFQKKIAGRETRQILADALPGLILKIPFPRSMYWNGKSGPRFIRPIRWIVALLGDAIVPFEVAGVRSSNETSGHRRLGRARVAVTFDSYEQVLRDNFVLLSADDRRKKIASETGVIHPDPALLETLVYLTEYPTAITGNFDPEFLTLPKEVLSTVMRHHQKYFSVETANGELAPQFVAVMNTDADREGVVQRGNERVLRARFGDARFFWDADQRKTLADRVSDLAHVTFQAKLGSYLEKTERVAELVRELGGEDLASGSAIRAAQLSKCDLTTELVKEFPELQGIVGGLYARAQGEPEEVALAIYDQYKPTSMEDSIPRTTAGRLLSLADKLDTLLGCFRVGLIPSGSKDPFALRRAAQGVVRIVVEGKIRISLKGGDTAYREFLVDRVRHYFKDVRGFRYDEVNAVLASGWDDLIGVEERLLAVRAVRTTENFEPLAASFKRIQNILKQAQFGVDSAAMDPALLEPGPETDLYQAFERVRGEAATMEYKSALETIATLRPKVDLFFDKVLVNAPDLKVRQNRLAFLRAMLAEFSTIADFSEIVTTS
ncbi:MAG: glycine--tRNA ligase subunit beta [Acidobacteriota bacterium]|nr:glycine--tRNA ligase subunit beta [Acidobacteriota bacterium]